MACPVSDTMINFKKIFTITTTGVQSGFRRDIGPFQLGILTSVSCLLLFHFIYACLTQTILALLLLHITKICLAFFCIFSFYTWITVVFGDMFSDANIYLISLLAVFSEFCGKYFLSHTILKNLNQLLGKINKNFKLL